MISDKFKKFKSFSILIIPDGGSYGTTTQKLTPLKIVTVIVLYTIVVFILSSLVIMYTPLRDLFITESNLSRADLQRINELNQKMIFLSKELQSLKSTNERLRYAIMLGDSTLIDSLPEEKSKNQNKLNKSGGNIFEIIDKLFSSSEQERDGKIKLEPLYYFYNPVNGYISREFYPERGHFGIDYVLKTGSPVYAAAGGYVIFSDYTTKDGNMIIINHSNDYITVYKHCSSLIKREREVVLQGDLIALSGNTGEESAGPHLHFEIWKNGQPIDPKEVLFNQ